MQDDVGEYEKQRIQKILATRDQSALIAYLSKKLSIDERNIENLMKSFENGERYEALLSTLTKVKNVQMSEDIKTLISIVSESKGFLLDDNVTEKIEGIVSSINFDRFTMPQYTFQDAGKNIVMRQGEEPEFEISDELRSAVFSNMNEDLSAVESTFSVEDKALYIYAKLCKLLEYDSEYVYWDKVSDNDYSVDFSAEKLKSIVPGSKVICQDFCRIYTKLINELGDDIDAVILKRTEKKGGHWLVGLYTSKLSLEMDSTNTSEDDVFDLANVKLGSLITGIKPISTLDGEEWEMTEYRDRLGKMVSNMNEGKGIASLSYYISMREPEERKKDFDTLVESFLEVVNTHNVRGTELLLVFFQFEKLGFFGPTIVFSPLKKSLLIKKRIDDGKEKYDRLIYFQQRKGVGNCKSIYCINTESGELYKEEFDDIQARIESGELMYQDKDYSLDDFSQEK